MATPTDTTFGTDFNADLFRSAIKSTMQMSMPSDSTEAVTFVWDVDNTFPVPDPAGDPYDWTATPTTTVALPEVQIPVAVEKLSRGSLVDGTALGSFNHLKIRLTVMDEFYDQVNTADKVRIEGALYNIDYWEAPVGLFEVTVHSAVCTSLDES